MIPKPGQVYKYNDSYEIHIVHRLRSRVKTFHNLAQGVFLIDPKFVHSIDQLDDFTLISDIDPTLLDLLFPPGFSH